MRTLAPDTSLRNKPAFPLSNNSQFYPNTNLPIWYIGFITSLVVERQFRLNSEGSILHPSRYALNPVRHVTSRPVTKVLPEQFSLCQRCDRFYKGWLNIERELFPPLPLIQAGNFEDVKVEEALVLANHELMYLRVNSELRGI